MITLPCSGETTYHYIEKYSAQRSAIFDSFNLSFFKVGVDLLIFGIVQ